MKKKMPKKSSKDGASGATKKNVKSEIMPHLEEDKHKKPTPSSSKKATAAAKAHTMPKKDAPKKSSAIDKAEFKKAVHKMGKDANRKKRNKGR
jgi:hypothetical protein